MGVSIYYTANRSYPLTEVETKSIEDIVKEYDDSKPFKDGEDFYVYDYDDEEPEEIFSGATGLPLEDDAMLTIEACLYWAKCLTKIRHVIKDAEWSVNMDETELEWDEIDGWQLPMDGWNGSTCIEQPDDDLTCIEQPDEEIVDEKITEILEKTSTDCITIQKEENKGNYSEFLKMPIEEFQKFTTPYELHEIACRSCSFELEKWIVESALCSEATALMIFWRMNPAEFLNYSWKKKFDDEIHFDIVRIIIKNFEKGFYQKTDIKYDPSDAISKEEFIPEVLLQACNGEEPYIYIDAKEVHSWFGDYLESKIHRCETTMELYNIAVSLKHREISVYEKVIDHPMCDKAIALIVYWLLDKYSVSALYAQEGLSFNPILKKIVKRLQNNEYQEILEYDPNKYVKPIKWKIPEFMFNKIE